MIRSLRLFAAVALACVSTPVLAQATYPTPAGSRVQGVVSLTCDANGANCVPVAGSAGAPAADAASGVTPSTSPTATGSRVIKASAGNLYGYNVTAGASAGYVLIYNATVAPADGTVTPSLCLPLAANAGIDQSYRVPEFYSTGIVIVFSTTGCFTQTLSATAFISGNAK